MRCPDITFGPSSGRFNLYISDTFGICDIYTSEKLLREAKNLDGAKVIFNNEDIGIISGLSYNNRTRVLGGSFDYLNVNEDIIAQQIYYRPIPILQYDYLGCCSCNSYYAIGDNKCGCIDKIKKYYVDKILISKIILSHINQYSKDQDDIKRDMISNHFGGVVYLL